MHLLATTSGVIDGAAEAVDLKQSPADIVILSAADSELANLARRFGRAGTILPSVRLANLLLLQHNYSVDLYCEQTLSKAKLIVVRLARWRELLVLWRGASLRALATETGAKLVILPGGSEADQATSGPFNDRRQSDAERLRQYFAIGGPENAVEALRFCAALIGNSKPCAGSNALSRCRTLSHRDRQVRMAAIGIVFYRSVIEGGQTAPIDQLCDALGRARPFRISPLHRQSERQGQPTPYRCGRGATRRLMSSSTPPPLRSAMKRRTRLLRSTARFCK